VRDHGNGSYCGPTSVAECGAYAALWDSWHGLPEPAER
jgi:hypothetical protein